MVLLFLFEYDFAADLDEATASNEDGDNCLLLLIVTNI
jgi:hypothetical protein